MHDEPESLYDDVQLTLENDGRFYRWCLRRLVGRACDSATDMHWKHALVYYYRPADKLTLRERGTLRRYFYERWIQQDSPAEATLTATVLPPTPQEIFIMSTKLTFTTRYQLNGNDLSTLTKDQVYSAIAAEEQRIAKLKEIQHQPKSLVDEIEQSEVALTTLVEHLDNA